MQISKVFQLNDEVIRTGPAADYTTGRQGTVIECIPQIGKWQARYRVLWHHDRTGSPLKVRTWVMPAVLDHNQKVNK